MASAKLISAMAYDSLTFEQQYFADPVIRVLGELPANSQPFKLDRVYSGPQGRCEEVILLVDPDNRVLWQRPGKFLELRGQMHEDLFRAEVTQDITISSTGEHAMVFLIDGAEAGRIPVFIEAPESLRIAGVLGDAANEALKKGSIMWLTIPQPDGSKVTRPAWYVQQGPKLFVVKGPGEQELPNLESVTEVELTVKSKDVKASIGSVPADVRRVENDSDEFAKIAGLGMGNRLNLPDGEGAAERWRTTAAMVELTPRWADAPA
jgi:hypothetical protein